MRFSVWPSRRYCPEVAVPRLQPPLIKPGMRFSRTRLSEVLHRAALGVARVIQPADLSADLARGATREVLGPGSYRRAAEGMRDEIAALPGPERAVELLQRLAVDRRLLTGG